MKARETPGWDLAEDSDRCAFCDQCVRVYMSVGIYAPVADNEGWTGKSRGQKHSSLLLQH